MRDRIVPLFINLKEYAPDILQHKDVLKEIEDAFNNREKLTIEITTSKATFAFELKSARKKNEYHPIVQMYSHERGYYHFRRYNYYMLAPFIGVIKPVEVKKSQVAGV
jgi:c-di-GMP-binding flagellar brake protein YcgR